MKTIQEIIDGWVTLNVWCHDIEGFPGYSVSAQGMVARKGKMLTPVEDHEYLVVTLSSNGEARNRRIHQLVLEAFVGPCPFPDVLVAHFDNDRKNNKLNNLRWATALENSADRIRHETLLTGSGTNFAKLTEADIPIIRSRLAAGDDRKDIAADFNVHKDTIWMIHRNRTWRHV